MFSQFLSIRQKITPGAHKIISNTSWLVLDKLLRMSIGLLVGAWLARYLGPEQFGLFNYAMAFVALFAPFAALGLDGIVVREILKFPEKSGSVLGSAFILKLISGFVSMGLATISIYFFRSDMTSRLLVIILATGFIFQSFDVIDFWFQSQIQSKNVVIAKIMSFVIVTILKIIFIQTGASLLVISMLTSIEILLGSVGLFMMYESSQSSVSTWMTNFNCTKKMLKDSFPLIFSSIAIVIYMKIDQIMLGQMLGDKAVGIYSVAVRLSEVWYFIPVAIASSITPAIIRARECDPQDYHKKIQAALSGVAFLAYLISVAMSFLAGWLITQLYGAAYTEASPILMIHIWTSIFVFLGVIRGIWLIAENLTVVYLQTTVLGALVNIGLNFILIPRYGGLGAAISTLISQAMASFIANLFFSKTRRIFWCQLRSILFPDPTLIFR
jgi:polysaccharide transporter, PST family